MQPIKQHIVRYLPAALRKFLEAHRVCLWLLAGAFCALGLFWAARGNTAAICWWVERVSMPVKWGISALADGLPCSVCELGATLLIAFVLARLGYTVWLAAARHQNRFGGWLLHTVTAGLWIYALVCGLWGTQYYIPGFAEKAGMTAGPVATEDLQAVTAYFAARVNETADAVPRTAAGTFAMTKTEILAAPPTLYTEMEARYPFLAGPVRRAKPAFYSRLMSAVGFTGYLCPLVGESTLNVDCPAVFLPVTVAHELAHQRGVAAEQEANFCGVLASVTAGDATYAYSGWLFGFLHLSNALYGTDPTAASALYATLCPAAQADMAENNAYWKKWEGPAKTAGETVYTSFLKGYDQPLGMQSYGACVDLLVEYYLPAAMAVAE